MLIVPQPAMCHPYVLGWYMTHTDEQLQLTSNPVADREGYSVEAIESKSGRVRRMPIPLMVVRVVEEEAASYDELLVA
jgi:hypothetical protein